MKRLVLVTLFCGFTAFGLFAQELKCEIELSYSQLSAGDPSRFEDMEERIYDFINNRKWTPDVFAGSERIESSILINLTKQVSNDRFEATIQISSRRPVYGSAYNTTVISHKDNDFNFTYQQFTVLEFSPTTFLNNLTSVLSYYVYLILAMDYDTFSEKGGTPYYQQALNIVNNAQSTEEPGWKSHENQNNRYWIIENILSPRFANLRQALYVYHRQGLDIMHEKPEEGRQKIYEALQLLEKVYQNVPNSINLRMFFNAKADEIVNIFSEAPREEQNKVINLLNTINPANTNKYQEMTD